MILKPTWTYGIELSGFGAQPESLILTGSNPYSPKPFVRSSTHPVGLNCSDAECEDEERAPCPPDSVIRGREDDSLDCVCSPSHCQPPPNCLYGSTVELRHRGTAVPGDCCDVYECILPRELNCTGVVCPLKEGECPPDSYRLPGRQAHEGDCCSVPQGCACLPGPCPPPPTNCPKGHSPNVTTLGTGQPGSCCPQYRCQPQESNLTCLDEGAEYANGWKWKRNECTECKCTKGFVLCRNTETCPPVPPACTSTSTPVGQCCPVCTSDKEITPVKPGGCKSGSGVIHENGASWKEDDCTSCTCVGGYRKCHAAMCHQTCPNATYVKGECCPRCEEDECEKECPHGYVKDGNGEELCECIPTQPECPSITNCLKRCKHGYKVNSAGCQLCRCEHCKPILKCLKRCPHGLQSNNKGCPICKCKGDEIRDDGEAWYDGCRQCYCMGGKEMCALVSCPKPDCPEPVMSKNSCCPTCPGNDSRPSSSVSHVVCQSGDGGVRREGVEREDQQEKVGEKVTVCHASASMVKLHAIQNFANNRQIQTAEHQYKLKISVAPFVWVNQISFALEKKEYCGGVFLDVAQAFDRVWHPGLLFKLKRILPSTYYLILQSYLTDRYSVVCHGEKLSGYIQIKASVPQGSVLGPLLYLVYTADIPTQTSTSMATFADDIYDGLPEEEVCQVGNLTFSVGDEWRPEECVKCTCEAGRTVTCKQRLCQTPCSADPCCPKCPEGEREWLKEAPYLVIVCVLMACCGAVGAVIVRRQCCLKRYQLKLAGCHRPPSYRVVPTYETTTHSAPPLERPPV
ncbi:hypothetical protein AAG570_001158 [Ranatra chinensis]|uniref:Cysteine-rich motor neuron 1 protein n=1 Tax=Ranatra chinensis TaxID=642074 RepID=A0ABD0YBB3_9HEMI